MFGTYTSGTAQLATLTLMLAGRVLSESELRAHYQPDCTDQFRGNIVDCQVAISHVWDLSGGATNTNGDCVEVATQGTCAIDLCNINDQKSSVDYAGIAASAQAILAVCRDDGADQSAGSAAIEGFQLPGQSHSVATVKLRLDATAIQAIGKREPAVKGRSPPSDEAKASLERRDRPKEYANNGGNAPYVEGERALFREDFAPETFFLLPQTRTALRDQLVNEWNRRSGGFFSGFIRRRAAAIEYVEGNTRYNIGVSGRDRRLVSDFPITDRPDIIDAFLRLHEQERNPRTYEAYIHDAQGNYIAMITLMINPVDAMPAPPRAQILFGAGSGI